MILTVYNDVRTVFRLKDIALLCGETDFASLNSKLNYHVRTGKLGNPRKGVYCKRAYNPEELACCLFTPVYISLEYVLQKAGVVFQYDSRITAVSYLSRNVEIEDQQFSFRKMKNELLVSTQGIVFHNNISIASPERALLDMLYLNGDMYFDNISGLDREKADKLLPLYRSEIMIKRAAKLFCA
jgi:hypothetical protein